MSKEQTLVDYIVDTAKETKRVMDSSMARRLIVEERVKVDGEVVADPAFRLPFESGFVVQITPVEKTGIHWVETPSVPPVLNPPTVDSNP